MWHRRVDVWRRRRKIKQIEYEGRLSQSIYPRALGYIRLGTVPAFTITITMDETNGKPC